MIDIGDNPFNEDGEIVPELGYERKGKVLQIAKGMHQDETP